MKTIDQQILAYLKDAQETFPFGVQRKFIMKAVNRHKRKHGRTTFFDALTRLEVKGYVVKRSERITRKRGRPPVFWRLSRKLLNDGDISK